MGGWESEPTDSDKWEGRCAYVGIRGRMDGQMDGWKDPEPVDSSVSSMSPACLHTGTGSLMGASHIHSAMGTIYLLTTLTIFPVPPS